ncbi:MAG: CoxG family protein [Candidatus Binatia bacterium]
MAIEIREVFQMRAPLDAVWRFVMDPQSVVTCMPGAQLDETVDGHTFLGSLKVKVGAITATYKGHVQFTQIDAQQHTVQLTAEGRETGGGMAKATMSSCLRALPDGRTEVVAEARVDLTGRIMQVGRGMIQGVAHQLFRQFVASLTQRLEAPGGGAPAATAPRPIRIVPLIFQVLWAPIVRFLRRLFLRPRKPP